MTKRTTDAKGAAEEALKTLGVQPEQQKGAGHLVLVVDRSGSMRGLEESVVTGANEFIVGARDTDARVWIGLFDQHPGVPTLEWVVRGVPARNVNDLGQKDFVPRGMTPLRDAVLTAIRDVQASAGSSDGAYFAILTDGKENASEASAETLKRAVEDAGKRGWAFVYIGANVDVYAETSSIGMAGAGQAMAFTSSPGGTNRALRYAGQQAVQYATTAAAGDAAAAAMDVYASNAAMGDVIPDVEPGFTGSRVENGVTVVYKDGKKVA